MVWLCQSLPFFLVKVLGGLDLGALFKLAIFQPSLDKKKFRRKKMSLPGNNFIFIFLKIIWRPDMDE